MVTAIRMCIKTNVPLHKTHAFERNVYHKVDNILKDLLKLPERGGRGGGGRMGKKNCLKIL